MNVFKLHASCIIVKGAKRGILYDLQRELFQYVPIGLCEILQNEKFINIESVKLSYNSEYDDIISEYFDFLIANEYGFFCNNPENFPDIDLTFESPEIINNAIVDIDENSDHDFKKIIQELTELRCKYLEIRLYCTKDLSFIYKVLSLSYGSSLKNIDIFLKYDKNVNEVDYHSVLLSKLLIIGRLIIHSAPFTKTFENEDHYRIHFIKQEILSEKCCGNIFINDFSTNIQLFTESQSHNNCLNKKISIDRHGNIKNCPSMKSEFGNHKNFIMKDVLDSTSFRNIWNVNKDQISTCKDCEYRYMCTDCRAFLETTFEKPKKCNYDPYTTTWK